MRLGTGAKGFSETGGGLLKTEKLLFLRELSAFGAAVRGEGGGVSDTALQMAEAGGRADWKTPDEVDWKDGGWEEFLSGMLVRAGPDTARLVVRLFVARKGVLSAEKIRRGVAAIGTRGWIPWALEDGWELLTMSDADAAMAFASGQGTREEACEILRVLSWKYGNGFAETARDACFTRGNAPGADAASVAAERAILLNVTGQAAGGSADSKRL